MGWARAAETYFQSTNHWMLNESWKMFLLVQPRTAARLYLPMSSAFVWAAVVVIGSVAAADTHHYYCIVVWYSKCFHMAIFDCFTLRHREQDSIIDKRGSPNVSGKRNDDLCEYKIRLDLNLTEILRICAHISNVSGIHILSLTNAKNQK